MPNIDRQTIKQVIMNNKDITHEVSGIYINISKQYNINSFQEILYLRIDGYSISPSEAVLMGIKTKANDYNTEIFNINYEHIWIGSERYLKTTIKIPRQHLIEQEANITIIA